MLVYDSAYVSRWLFGISTASSLPSSSTSPPDPPPTLSHPFIKSVPQSERVSSLCFCPFLLFLWTLPCCTMTEHLSFHFWLIALLIIPLNSTHVVWIAGFYFFLELNSIPWCRWSTAILLTYLLDCLPFFLSFTMSNRFAVINGLLIIN